MSKQINSYQAMAAMTRAFFEAFGCGIIDSNYPNGDFATRNDEKNIKQVMLNHYESISKKYFDIMFPIIVRIQYNDVEQALNDASRNFANKMLKLGILEETGDRPKNAARTVPVQYMFNPDKYKEMKSKGFRLEF